MELQEKDDARRNAEYAAQYSKWIEQRQKVEEEIFKSLTGLKVGEVEDILNRVLTKIRSESVYTHSVNDIK